MGQSKKPQSFVYFILFSINSISISFRFILHYTVGFSWLFVFVIVAAAGGFFFIWFFVVVLFCIVLFEIEVAKTLKSEKRC